MSVPKIIGKQVGFLGATGVLTFNGISAPPDGDDAAIPMALAG